MNYLTAERYIRLQRATDERALQEAMADWERASDEYREYVKSISPNLPPALVRFFQHVSLHDATLIDDFRSPRKLTIVVKSEAPAEKRFLLEYSLAEDPQVETNVLAPEYRSSSALWLYDEIGLGQPRFAGAGPVFRHSILLGDGRELTLWFSRFDYSERQPGGIASQAITREMPAALSPCLDFSADPRRP